MFPAGKQEGNTKESVLLCLPTACQYEVVGMFCFSYFF